MFCKFWCESIDIQYSFVFFTAVISANTTEKHFSPEKNAYFGTERPEIVQQRMDSRRFEIEFP